MLHRRLFGQRPRAGGQLREGSLRGLEAVVGVGHGQVLPRYDPGLVVGQPGEEARVVAGFVEKLQEVLELPRALVLEEPLGVAGRLNVPFVHGLLLPGEMAVEGAHQLLPSVMHGRLVQQAVDGVGMAPVGLGATGLVVLGDVVEVAIAGGQEGGAEAAGPGGLALGELDDAVGVGAGGAAVGLAVVLVERVGAPEDTIAARTGVLLVPFVELVLVALPVEFALELGVAEAAPVGARRRGHPDDVALDRYVLRELAKLAKLAELAELAELGRRRRRRGSRGRRVVVGNALLGWRSHRGERRQRGRIGDDAGAIRGAGARCGDGETHPGVVRALVELVGRRGVYKTPVVAACFVGW